MGLPMGFTHLANGIVPKSAIQEWLFSGAEMVLNEVVVMVFPVTFEGMLRFPQCIGACTRGR